MSEKFTFAEMLEALATAGKSGPPACDRCHLDMAAMECVICRAFRMALCADCNTAWLERMLASPLEREWTTIQAKITHFDALTAAGKHDDAAVEKRIALALEYDRISKGLISHAMDFVRHPERESDR